MICLHLERQFRYGHQKIERMTSIDVGGPEMNINFILSAISID